jgi:hypothetical protein
VTLRLRCLMVVSVAIVGCARRDSPPPLPPEVLVTPVVQRDVPVFGDWIGTLDGSVNADIRPKVEGYLMRQFYKEGQFGLLHRRPRGLHRCALANLRYVSGLSAYFEVLESQQQLFPAEITLAQTRRDQLIAVVDLYRALGGGWKAEPLDPAARRPR